MISSGLAADSNPNKGWNIRENGYYQHRLWIRAGVKANNQEHGAKTCATCRRPETRTRTCTMLPWTSSMIFLFALFRRACTAGKFNSSLARRRRARACELKLSSMAAAMLPCPKTFRNWCKRGFDNWLESQKGESVATTSAMSWTLDKKSKFQLAQVLQWFEYKDKLFLASSSRPDDEEDSTSDSSTDSMGIVF